jgi:putative Ca2+/H+ antiporter (TMEM165/GDT1 family)
VTLSPTVVLIAFGLVFPVELPDKTLVATVLLAARYRPLPVFVGVCCAFAVQCVIAVAFGGLLTLLPQRLVAALVAVMFGIGAVALLREGFGRQDADEPDATADAARPAVARSFPRIAITAFGVLFVAEFGDASQLAIAALTARYGAPLSVGIGAWLALVSVAAIAVLVGKRAGDRLPRRLFQRVAGGVFAVLALLAATEAL